MSESGSPEEPVLNSIVWSYLRNVDPVLAAKFRQITKARSCGKRGLTLRHIYDHYVRTAPEARRLKLNNAAKRGKPDIVPGDVQRVEKGLPDVVADVNGNIEAAQPQKVTQDDNNIIDLTGLDYPPPKRQRLQNADNLVLQLSPWDATPGPSHVRPGEKEHTYNIDTTSNPSVQVLDLTDLVDSPDPSRIKPKPSSTTLPDKFLFLRSEIISTPSNTQPSTSTANINHRKNLNSSGSSGINPQPSSMLPLLQIRPNEFLFARSEIISAPPNTQPSTSTANINNTKDFNVDLPGRSGMNPQSSSVLPLLQIRPNELLFPRSEILSTAPNTPSTSTAHNRKDLNVDLPGPSGIELQPSLILPLLQLRQNNCLRSTENILHGEHLYVHQYKEEPANIELFADEINQATEETIRPPVDNVTLVSVPEKANDNKETEVNKNSGVEGIENSEYKKLLQLETQGLIPNIDAFTCSVCLNDCEAGTGWSLHECLHSYCRQCGADLVNNCGDAQVACPYRTDDGKPCKGVLSEREVRALVSTAEYEAHLTRGLRLAEASMRDSFHCRTPDCQGFVVHDENVDRFDCPLCRTTNCLRCQAIHTNESCSEYKARIAHDEEFAGTGAAGAMTKKALELLMKQGKAMHCPGCRMLIQKEPRDCDWVLCSMCKIEICWATKGPRWGPAGHGDNSGGCRCRVKGKRCHPKCKNCH